MAHHCTAQICLSGHIITGDINNSDFLEKFCSICSKETITHCPSCNANIRGYYDYADSSIITIPNCVLPAYCYNCGNPFPWTQAKLDTAKKLIAEMDELNADEQNKFNESLPDIIAETPMTVLAATRINRYLNKVAPIFKEGIKTLFFDITVEAAKKMIWPV